MMRYLQRGLLEKEGLLNFDSWASTFGESITAIELNPTGTGYRTKPDSRDFIICRNS